MAYLSLIQKIDQYKRKEKKNPLICIPVYNNETIVAYLRPITTDYQTTIPECVELLSKWRKENPSLATGTFEITHERTEKWLHNLVLFNDNRLLFLISDLEGIYLGHIGLAGFNEEERSAEIDSVLRGNKSTTPGLMTFCLNALMQWGKQELHLTSFSLEVFSDNTHAVDFYKKCGFQEDYLIPMIKTVFSNEEKWEQHPDITAQDADRYFLRMVYKGDL